MVVANVLGQLIAKKDLIGAKAFLAGMHAEEVVTAMRELGGAEQLVLFRLLDRNRALEVFELLDRTEQSALVRGMEDPEIARLLEGLDTETRLRVFDELPAKVVKRILRELSPEARASVNVFLGYPEDSAGRVMSPDYLALPETASAGEALRRVRQSDLTPENLEVVFVLGPGRTYRGYVPLARLLRAEPEAPVGTLVVESRASVSAFDSQDRVAELFKLYEYPLIAVVDSEGRLVGAIDAERAFELIQEYDASRLTTFGGVLGSTGPDVDILRSPLLRIYRARVFWLAVLTVFGVITSTFVARQEELLSSAIVLAAFIAPIIDMGGNTGSQTATLVIRAMALGDVRVRIRDLLAIIRRDIPIALAMGVTIGILEAILAFLSKGVGVDILLVVGLAMLTVTILGSLIGVALPFAARRLGYDPATLSGPAITSIMDLLGVFIYFGYAYIFLADLLEK